MARFFGRLIRNWGWWLGIAIGLAVIVPKILLQYGIMIGTYGFTWFTGPGFITACFMAVGVFYENSRFVYPLMALGVVLTGLFYAAIASAGSWIFRRMRGTGPE
jgi:hypothetical protein